MKTRHTISSHGCYPGISKSNDSCKFVLYLLTWHLFQCCILYVTFLLESTTSCYPGWKPVGPSCLRFFVNTRRTWDGARASCRQLGGDLALLKKPEPVATDLMKLLMSMTNTETDLFVGFHRTSVKTGPDTWMWNDGKHVDDQRWKSGYPLNGDENSCGALSSYGHDMKLLNVECSNMNGFICESFEGIFTSFERKKKSFHEQSMSLVDGSYWTSTIVCILCIPLAY